MKIPSINEDVEVIIDDNNNYVNFYQNNHSYVISVKLGIVFLSVNIRT